MVDVLVIGGGNAALCAALMAREAGASVLLLEASPRQWRGGNSQHTRNLRCMHDAPKDVLIEAYTEEEYWQDLLKITGGITNAFFMGGGKALINAYSRSAEKLGVQIRYDTPVASVQLDGDRFVAVHTATGERISARSCVLAAWGWRIPFLIGCAIVPFIFLLRNSVQETEEFQVRRHHPSRDSVPARRCGEPGGTGRGRHCTASASVALPCAKAGQVAPPEWPCQALAGLRHHAVPRIAKLVSRGILSAPLNAIGQTRCVVKRPAIDLTVCLPAALSGSVCARNTEAEVLTDAMP